MPNYCGVYGLAITEPIVHPDFALHPATRNRAEARKLAKDTHELNLTAVLEVADPRDRELRFDLAAVFTFCEQQWVVITQPLDAPGPDEALAAFDDSLNFGFRRWTTGRIVSDTFSPGATGILIALCLDKLRDPKFINDEGTFRKAFFFHVESWRQAESYIDVTYYLEFAALEMLARAYTQDFSSPVASPLCALLNQIGFTEFKQDNPADRMSATQTYARLRNALFHNGKFAATFNENGTEVTLRITDYEDQFRMLVPDVFLRVMGYDDDSINWNRWRDRQPFTRRDS